MISSKDASGYIPLCPWLLVIISFITWSRAWLWERRKIRWNSLPSGAYVDYTRKGTSNSLCSAYGLYLFEVRWTLSEDWLNQMGMMMGKGQQMHMNKLTSIRLTGSDHSQTVVKEGFRRLCVKHSDIFHKERAELMQECCWCYKSYSSKIKCSRFHCWMSLAKFWFKTGRGKLESQWSLTKSFYFSWVIQAAWNLKGLMWGLPIAEGKSLINNGEWSDLVQGKCNTLASSYLSLHWALQRARSSLSLTPPLSQVNFVSENPISIRPQSWIHWANLRQYTPKFLRPLLLIGVTQFLFKEGKKQVSQASLLEEPFLVLLSSRH